MYTTTLRMDSFLKKKIVYPILGLIILIHFFVITRLLFFPYQELFIYPYLTNHGFKPYSQILDQHFPGLMFFSINLNNLGMNNEFSARIWLLAVIVITQGTLFFVSSQIFKSKQRALLVNLLYLVWQPFFEGWVFWIDSFLPPILLLSLYFLYSKRMFTTGVLLGIGIIFKQTLIPLGMLVFLVVLWESKKISSVVKFLAGLFIPLGLMLVYLGYMGVIPDFWYWTVIFNLTTYAKYGTNIPTNFSFISRAGFVYLTSVFGLFGKDRRIVKLLTVFLLGSLIGILDRSDFVHLQPSLPFALIFTSIGIYQYSTKISFRLLMFVYIMIAIWWLNIFYRGHISNKVFTFDDQTKLTAQKIRHYTEPGDKIFVFGAPPILYQMTDTLPAGDVFVFQFPWFIKIAGSRLLEGIKNDLPKIIVSDTTVKIENQPITDFGKQISQYINENYQTINQIGTNSILSRKAR